MRVAVVGATGAVGREMSGGSPGEGPWGSVGSSR